MHLRKQAFLLDRSFMKREEGRGKEKLKKRTGKCRQNNISSFSSLVAPFFPERCVLYILPLSNARKRLA
jgi:hypothetical protein